MTKKVAVILSGCGHQDGTEIREAVVTLLELDRRDANVRCFAPDTPQAGVVNHLNGDEMDEQRNVIVESARIARGEIKPLSSLNVDDFDALVMPGGFGAAKNLSDVAFKGADATVAPDLKTVIHDFIDARKPIGAICIAPAVLAAALKGKLQATVTIGDDVDGLIAGLGAVHQYSDTENCIVDEEHKIVTCSAYMRDDRLKNVAEGIRKTIEQVLQLV
jgi:enhancing lycopene biosynthesis protein 2